MDPAADIPGAPSQRVRLARVALAAARRHPDVAAGHAGASGLSRTPDAGGWLDGVTVIAERDGRYAIELHLIAWPVPLHELADEVTELVRQGAQERGLGPIVGPVTVHFEDLAERPA